MELTRISGYGHVAKVYGLDEAIFLDSIMYWWRENKANGRNLRDGRYWTYNTVRAFSELFPWWTAKQVRRIADSCRDKGALVIGHYNSDGRDRTIWYSPSDDLLGLYGVEIVAAEESPICPNGQMQMPEQADSFAQTGEPLPCSNHVDTTCTPLNPPKGDEADDGFENFWKAYPRKEGKKAALRAWRKIKPDKATCVAMAAALKRAKASPQWTKDSGQYIPMASTWLNGERWKDEGVTVKPPAPSGGWADDPEVIR